MADVRSLVISTTSQQGVVSSWTFADTDFRSGGKLYMSHSVGGPIYESIKYRPVGVQGNFVTRTGFAGQPISFVLQFVNTMEVCLRDISDAMYAMKARNCSITLNMVRGSSTYTQAYPRCTCESFVIQSGPTALMIPAHPTWVRYIVGLDFTSEDPIQDAL